MLSILATSALFLPTAAGDGWHADFDAAVAEARETGKDLFVDFTGSDWCGWCIKLGEEVFQHDAFLDAAREDYVLVALDFPQSPEIQAKVPNPDRNNELRDRYEIRGYPTILMMNVDGDVFAQMGYQEGGPEKYIETMRTQAETGKAMLTKSAELVAAFEAAEGDARLPLLEQAVALVEEITDNQSTIGIAALSPVVSEAMELQGEEHRALAHRAAGLLLSAKPDPELIAKVAGMDPENTSGLYEKALIAEMQLVADEAGARALHAKVMAFAEGMKPVDGEAVAELYAIVAMWNERNFADHEAAVELAELALATHPEIDPRMKEMLDSIIGEPEEADSEETPAEEEAPVGRS